MNAARYLLLEILSGRARIVRWPTPDDLYMELEVFRPVPGRPDLLARCRVRFGPRPAKAKKRGGLLVPGFGRKG